MEIKVLRIEAPSGDVTPYDRHHLALYAALLDAETMGTEWRDAARTLMLLNPEGKDTQRCWKSHLDRARWIVGEGLAQACTAFGSDFGSFDRVNDR